MEGEEPPSSRRWPSIISSRHISWPLLSEDLLRSAKLSGKVEKVQELPPMFSKILWQILLSVILKSTMNRKSLSRRGGRFTSCLLLLRNYCESSIGNWLHNHHFLLSSTWETSSILWRVFCVSSFYKII